MTRITGQHLPYDYPEQNVKPPKRETLTMAINDFDPVLNRIVDTLKRLEHCCNLVMGGSPTEVVAADTPTQCLEQIPGSLLGSARMRRNVLVDLTNILEKHVECLEENL